MLGGAHLLQGNAELVLSQVAVWSLWLVTYFLTVQFCTKGSLTISSVR